MLNIDTNLPTHIAFIMDGNGRWAKSLKKDRSLGHRKGVDSTKKVIKGVLEYQIPFVSLYAFSTENWCRPKWEVSFLMELIERHLRKELPFYHDNNIRITVSGDRSSLPPKVIKAINDIEEATKDNSALTANLLINYGGQNEIVRSVNRWIKSNPGKYMTKETIEQNFDYPELPPVDLLIRSGGESRVSNCMIWQIAYAEIYIQEKMWPEWGTELLKEALLYYQTKERRFGGLK